MVVQRISCLAGLILASFALSSPKPVPVMAQTIHHATYKVMLEGDGTPSGKQESVPQSSIMTEIAFDSGAPTEVWPNVPVTATAINPSCSPSTDPNCIVQVSGTTDSSGKFTFSSDAIPGEWEVTATPTNPCPNPQIGFTDVETDFFANSQVFLACQVAE